LRTNFDRVWNAVFPFFRIAKIPFLVLITGQKCTLKYKDCGNFSPFLPQTFYELESKLEGADKTTACSFCDGGNGENIKPAIQVGFSGGK
jgi:hypothetical protein